MKLSSALLLYKSHYPSATPWSVSIDTHGSASVSDRRGTFRLTVEPSGRGNRLAALYARDNRRELFMIRETRNLYGIVYAENMLHDLALIAQSPYAARLPRNYHSPLRLSYLLALGGMATESRYSGESLTLTADGAARLSLGNSPARTLGILPGGKTETVSSANPPIPPADSTATRYARLFWRDNAEWFANFAAGRLAFL